MSPLATYYHGSFGSDRWSKVIAYDSSGTVKEIRHFYNRRNTNLFGTLVVERLLLLARIKESILRPFREARKRWSLTNSSED